MASGDLGVTRHRGIPLVLLLALGCAPSEPSGAGTGGAARGGTGGGGAGVSAGGSGGQGGSGGSSAGMSAAGQGGAIAGAGAGAGAAGSSGANAGRGDGGRSGAGGAAGDGSKAGAGAGGVVAGAGGGGSGGDAGGGAAGASGGGGSSSCSGPVGTFSGELASGIAFIDTDGERVNAHGGGIIREANTFYLHGEYFLSTSTANDFVGFSMYSSDDLSTWKNEGIVLPQQPSGELGPNRKGERPHIIKCPATGEFVLYAHAASQDYQTDKEVVFATSPTVNGTYAYRGPLENGNGQLIVHSDMSAYADDTGAYVLTESGHVFSLTEDCHGWLSDRSFSAVNGDSGGIEAPTVFRAGDTYYWLGSYKTGWRANNDFYSTAPAMLGPWTFQGFIAPVDDPTNNISDERTWLSQVTWVEPIVGCQGTVYLYFGDHWDGTESTTAPGRHNDLATYVFQPLVFDGPLISLPVYRASWLLDVGAGTWSE